MGTAVSETRPTFAIARVQKGAQNMSTRVARNVAVLFFLAVALLLPPQSAVAHPWEGICESTATGCYGWYVDFWTCSKECSELLNTCFNWCKEVGEYPFDWFCLPESGTPTSGWCYCSNCPDK